ncbi:unnamed protein product [Colias eurytheme]|nr:unnamed protein product [Colias eurytheme]
MEKKKRKRSWKNLRTAMDKVLSKELSIRQAAMRYNIPKSTLHDKITRKKALNEGEAIKMEPKLVRFINSQRGQSLVMLNNYTFARHYPVKEGYRWKCSSQYSKACPAHLTISNAGELIRKNEDHTHFPPNFVMNGNTFVRLPETGLIMVKGRNGKNLLMLNGYTYYQHKLLRDGFRWSCTQMGSRSCRGFLHVSADMMVVRAYIQHTHPPYATYYLHNVKKNLSNARKNNKLKTEIR